MVRSVQRRRPPDLLETDFRINFFSLGVDGWWLDASEAELSGKWGEFRGFNTADGPGAKVFNAYPLMHTTGVYEGQRAETSARRVFILTRSAYAGQQRNAAVSWSGDIHGNWDVFRKQIPAGLNFIASGIPYWNTDIGGFFGGDPAQAGYAELFTRWFQFGAFTPMFRVHGTGKPKEIWRFDPDIQQILIRYNELRHRLVPYIYSTSWRVTSEGYTLMRPLAFDFRRDDNVLNLADQFMFGPAIMVNPVVQPAATNRDVYLPAGQDWFDFWTGQRFPGGQHIQADAPLATLPLFVKAGSIIPLGPSVQYLGEKPADPMELRVYPGERTALHPLRRRRRQLQLRARRPHDHPDFVGREIENAHLWQAVGKISRNVGTTEISHRVRVAQPRHRRRGDGERRCRSGLPGPRAENFRALNAHVGGARLPTSRLRKASARQARLARTLAPPKIQTGPMLKF